MRRETSNAFALVSLRLLVSCKVSEEKAGEANGEQAASAQDGGNCVSIAYFTCLKICSSVAELTCYIWFLHLAESTVQDLVLLERGTNFCDRTGRYWDRS